MTCYEHLDFIGAICPDCGLTVDDYGNTEVSFDFCCYPDCGCDGERLCMAKNGASERSRSYNKEGMYTKQNPKDRLRAVGDMFKDKK